MLTHGIPPPQSVVSSSSGTGQIRVWSGSVRIRSVDNFFSRPQSGRGSVATCNGTRFVPVLIPFRGLASGGLEFRDGSNKTRVDRNKPRGGGPGRAPLNGIVTRPRSYALRAMASLQLGDRPSLHPIAFCHTHASLTLWPLWSPSLSLPNQTRSVLRDLLNKTAQLTLVPSLRDA